MYFDLPATRMIAPPEDLTVRPELTLPMDPLSEVLRSVRLKGAVFLSGEFTAPWCVSVSFTGDDCARFVSRAVQVIGYHVVTEGRFLVEVEGEPTFEVGAGEIVLFPRNDHHVLASEPGLETVVARGLIQPSPGDGLSRIVHGGGGATTRIMCGFLASAETCSPLMATLPRALKIDMRRGLAREWVEASVRFAANELAEGRLASSSVMSRLSESLLTEAVRQYSTSQAEAVAGWLKGLKDPQIGRALALIHQQPSASWTTDTLASEVALSRSVFAERFATLVGMPPMRYLTVLRLQTARLDLRETRRSIAELAFAAGYESSEAFSRAFKREFGQSPAQWREASAPEA